MQDRAERLLALSTSLTGFTAFQLRSTGMLEAYLAALDARLPQALVDRLLASDGGEATLDDPALGPVARNVIVLWYCGSWTLLPDNWSATTGIKDPGPTGVISADAYQAGLQWAVAGAHPAGARQQGFGAWALPPGAVMPGAVMP